MTDGVLVVHKEEGVTSHDVVARVRRVVGRGVSVGHAGTLDPFATGVLVVVIGRATKLVPVFVGLDKVYDATLRLGRVTTTDDRTGDTIAECGVRVTPAEVEAACVRFVGAIDQVPPQVSAVRVGGERMYRRARRGESVTLAPRRVTIHAIDVASVEGPLVRLHVRCGSGTYVRALARDLGAVLGVGGSLEALVRLEVGPFSLDRALDSRALYASDARVRFADALLSMERATGFLPAVRLTREQAERVANGQAPAATEVTIEGDTSDARGVRLLAPHGALLALADAHARDAHGRLVLLRVLREWPHADASIDTGAA